MCLLDAISYQELSFVLTVLYFSMAIHCFLSLFKRFKRDSSLSRPEKFLCWKVLAIATLLWPIVLPISSLEKQMFHSSLENVFWH
jgi:hypothetical protein